MKNENTSFKYKDSLNVIREIEINPSTDFELVQKDKNIHDVKFHKKATTFFKDSMKRFVKNKSSVAGGVILGFIILCALIMPVAIPNNGAYNVETTQLSESELQPKLFDNANGFWDGTIARDGYAYDKTTGLPVGYTSNVATNVETYDVVENKATQYGEGGSVMVTVAPYSGATSDLIGIESMPITLDLANKYTLDLTTAGENVEGYKLSDYRVLLVSNDQSISYLLTGQSSSNGYVKDNGQKLTIDVNSALTSINKDFSASTLENYRVLFGIKPDKAESTLVAVSSLHLKSSDATDNKIVSQISFDDGNTMMLQEEQKIVTTTTVDENGDKTDTEETVDNLGYWKTNVASKGAYKVTCHYCNFRYDKYQEIYGDVTKTINSAYITLRIKYGYMSFDFSGITDGLNDTNEIAKRFTILNDEKCSIREIKSITGTPKITYEKDGKTIKRITGISCVVVASQYREMGYSSMPRFIFGTNGKGQDFFKKICYGLRLSLLIAFGVSAINIVIGLIWGSISGYFGGWTDIIMERITDIIGGLPTMVIITLCILYAHNDILAMLVALFMTGWMGVAYRTRTQFYRFKGSEYVLASRTLGAKDNRLIFRHILPNSMGTIITSSILMIPSVMYTEASIAYLGLGLKDTPLFGVILSEGNAYFQSESTFLLVIPTLIMMFMMIAFNLFGNGLRDAFNPSLKGSE